MNFPVPDYFTLFDVGANWGTDSLARTRDDPRVSTWAFEPTPELAEHLRKESRNFATRYRVAQVALSDFNGPAEFHVAAHADWGTSSLLPFSEGLDKTWPGRRDFYVDQTIRINVRRFDTWYSEFRKPMFTKIDFFHCDTQGSDLAVLRGMGDHIDLIVEGCIECPQTPEVRLYQGQHTREEAMDFLADKGFEVYRVESQQNEDNLFFKKKA